MKSAGKARNNGLYRHIRTSKEIIRNLLNDCVTYKTLRVSCLAYGSRQTRRRTAPGAMTVKTKESALTDMKIRKCAFLCVYTSVVMIICAGRCVPNN